MRVEDCPFSIRVGELFPGEGATGGDGIVRVGPHSVAYKIATDEDAHVALAYVADDGVSVHPCCQRIALAPSWERFVALGWWFTCPGCARRVEKLYLPSARARFACRRCAKLIYTSSQTHDNRVDRLRHGRGRVLSILSGGENVSETTFMLALKAAALGEPRRHGRRACE